MTLRVYIQLMFRESKGAMTRLAYFIVCLSIGVAAVVSVGSLASSFQNGFQDGAKELLGADILLQSWDAFPEDLPDVLEELMSPDQSQHVAITYMREQPSLITGPNNSMLVEIKSVRGAYPVYGSLDMDPPHITVADLGDTEIIVEPDILEKLGVSVGDILRLGGIPFTITGVARSDPDRITGFMYIAPRIIMRQEAFGLTGLAKLSPQIRYKALIALDGSDAAALTAFTEAIKDELGADSPIRVENYLQGRPSLQRGLKRVEAFLGLVALLSLMLGGVGVSQAVRKWIQGRMDSIAVLKCLGMRPRQILLLYFANAALLGILGSGLGIAAAVILLKTLPPLLADYIPVDFIQPVQPMAMLSGLLLGTTVTLVFSIPALISILRVPPSRVFRRNAEALPEARWVPFAIGMFIIAAIGLMAYYQASSPILGAIFTVGVLGGIALLAGAAYILIRIMTVLPRDTWNVQIRHGLASLSRPNSSTLASIVSIGMGVLVLFTTLLIQSHLNHQFESEIPDKAPSLFLAGVSAHQTEGLETLLTEAGGEDLNLVPMSRAKISHLNGVPVAEAVENIESRWRRRNLMEDQFVTFMDTLPSNNAVLEGELWSDPDRIEVTLEEEYADDYGLSLGDTLTLSFSGEETELLITSIRQVEWEEDMSINFQVVIEPGTELEATANYLITVRLPRSEGDRLQDIVAKEFPGVLYIQVSEVLDRIISQLTRIGWGIRFLSMFIVGAGLAVLAGTIGIESQQRGSEVALLKTLGMTRRGIGAAFATEYALVGTVAAVVGIATGTAIAYAIITRTMEMEFILSPTYTVIGLAATVSLTIVVGLLASLPALQRPPSDTFREH